MKELSLREIQLSSLEILKFIDKYCRKNGLKYFLAYGTLLGAVRHKGFIPWDDDIDIMMPREDYEKFINYCIKNEEKIAPLKILSTKNNPDYPHMIARMSDTRYELIVDNELPYGLGAFVDIYPVDFFANSTKEAKKIKDKASCLSSLCFLSTRVHFKIGHTKGAIKKIIKYPAFIYAKILGKNHFIKKLNRMAKKYSCQNKEYAGCLVWGTDGMNGVFKKELFDETIELPFEGRKYFAPKRYNEILTKLYKDYMKIPPKSKQIPHHDYKAYKK